MNDEKKDSEIDWRSKGKHAFGHQGTDFDYVSHTRTHMACNQRGTCEGDESLSSRRRDHFKSHA